MKMLYRAALPCLLVWSLTAGAQAAMAKGPKISVKDDPSLKNGSPALVLIEVSDFQCPYCGKGTREVLPKVYENFVKPGKLEIIYLDFPLSMHPHAWKAAEAAACADAQNRFWDMHDQLFGHQTELSPEQLAGHAAEIGLDMEAFQKCLSTGRQAPGVREDQRTAQGLGINSTPYYLLGRRIEGGDKVQILDEIKGLPPYDDLAARIEAQLMKPGEP